MSYAERLNACKAAYTFDTDWKDRFDGGLTQYNPQSRAAVKAVFDTLISVLAAKGEPAPEAEKVELFRQAVLSLNGLDKEIDGLIETGEREELCELINLIGEAAGIPRDKYGSGEGLASEWRDW